MHRRAVLLVALVAACSDTPRGQPSSLSMHLTIPSHLAGSVTALTLSVFDGAECMGADASGTPLPGLGDIALIIGEAKTIQVPAGGTRTFYVLATGANDVQLARGCAERFLEPGMAYDIPITLVDFPPPMPDAGLPDASIDAGVTLGDDCASPLPLPVDTPTPGTTVGAGNDYGSSCGGGGPDVVYQLDVPVASHATITVDAPTAAVTASLRSMCDTPQTEAACATPDAGGTSIIDIGNLPAGSYFILVDASDPTVLGPFTITATLGAPTLAPPNDTCLAPEVVVPGDATPGTLTDGADDAAGSCGGGSGADAFYELELTMAQRVELQVTGVGFDPVIHLRSNCNDPASELTPAADGCGDDEGGATETHVIRELAAGTYYIVVDSTGASGDFTLQVDLLPPPPPNDLCAAADSLTPGVTTMGDSSAANDDQTPTCGPAGGVEVYYTFTLATAQHVTIDLADDVGSAHTLALQSGCPPAAMAVQCESTAGATETIDIPSLAAGTYVVVVDGSGGPGLFDVTLTLTPAIPPADECVTEGALAVDVTSAGSLAGADDDDTGSCGGGGGTDEVYSFTLLTARHITISSGAGFDHVVYLRSSCGDTLTEIACAASSAGAATIDIGSLAAGTWHVWIDRTAGASDAYTLLVDDVGPPILPPSNDSCASATPLANGVTLTGQTLAIADDTTSASCSAAGITLDVFYTVTVAATSVVDIVVTSPAINPTVALLDTTCTVETTCSAVSSPGEAAHFVDVAPGTYRVLVDGPTGGGSSTFNISYTATAVPANNSCVAPEPLVPGTSEAGTLVTATNEYAGTCGGGSGGDVVYEFTIGAPQRVQTTVTRTSGTFDPIVYLRSTCADEMSEPAGGCSNTSTGGTEVLDLDSLPAGTYQVIVDSAGGTPGAFTILVEALPVPPANDECPVPPSALLTEGVPMGGTTVGARNETTGTCSAGGNEVYYSFTLPAGGGNRRVMLDLTGATVQHALYVQGTCGSAASQQGCASTGALDETLDLLNLAPGTYTVVVEAEGATGGSGFTLSYTTAAPVPPADECIAEGTLALDVTTAGSLTGANDNDSGSCGGVGDDDEVYAFTLGAARHVTITTTAGFGHVVYLRSSCAAPMTEIACAPSIAGTTSIDFPNLAAGTWHVWIDRTAAGTDAYTILVDDVGAPILPPPNDSCAAATALSNGATLTGQTLVGADDTTSGSCAPAGTTLDVFYTITVAALSVVDINVTNTSMNTTVALMNTTCGATTVCSAATSPGEAAHFVDVAPGTYRVIVDGPTGGVSGTFDISYTATAVPANNSCAAPEPLVPGTSEAGTLVTSTNEYAGSCGGGSGGDVVYQFTIGAPQRVRTTVTRTSGTFDPIVYLRTTCTDELSEPAGGCSNTSTGGTEVNDLTTLAAGTYQVIVDSAGGTPGGFTILVEALPVPPDNDECPAPASALLTEGVPLAGTTVGARNETTGSCSAGGNEVYYTFTIPAGGNRRVVLSLTGATIQHALYVQSTCGSAATQQGCTSTGALNETLDLLNLPPGTYTAVVEAESAAGSAFSISYTTFAPVPNDTCSSPVLLSEPSTTLLAQTSVGALDQETGTCAGAGSPDVIYTYTTSTTRHVTISVTSTYNAAISLRTTCNNSGTQTVCQNAVSGAGTEVIDVRNQPPGTYYLIVDGVAGATGTFDVAFTTSDPPPMGDWCPEAQALATGVTTGQELTASYAHDDAGSCGGAGRDHVYSFTIGPGPKHVTLSVNNATIAHKLYLRATTCQTGTEQGCSSSSFGGGVHSSSLDLASIPAGTYYAFVDATNAGEAGTFDISLAVSDPGVTPPNDTCATATPLIEGVLTPGSLDGGNDSTATCVAGANNDVFFQFTLPAGPGNRYLTLTSVSGFNTSMTLRMSDCATEVAGTTTGACVNATGTGEQIIHENLAPGTYFVVVEGVGGATGAFNIAYTTAAPIVRPPNDQCAGAITLTSGVGRTGDSNVNGLDNADGSCGESSGAIITGDVVYTFNIPGPGNARARMTVSNATGFDPILYLRSASCTGAEVACSQAATGGTEILDLPNLAPGDYWLWVDPITTGSGTFDLLLELLAPIPPPGNDVCAGADPLVAGIAETHSTLGAADDYDLSCVAFDGRDTVHSFTLASASAVLVTITPLAPLWEVAAALRTSANCATTTDISCVDDGFTNRYINRPTLAGGGAVYDVVVDGVGGQSGDYTIKYETRAADATFGYWPIDTTGTYTPVTGGTTIVIPVTNWGVDSGTGPGDEWSQGLSLPFTFDYYGTPQTTITVSSNMFLVFGSAPTGAEHYTNDCPLDSTVPNDTIAPFWDDGISRTAYPTQLITKTEGVAPNRRFIIEFKDWDQLSCGMTTCFLMATRVNHQVILYENGDLEFRYGPRQPPGVAKNCTGGNGGATMDHELGRCATIGLEGQVMAATDVDSIQCNTVTPAVTDGRVIYWVHPR